MESNQAMGVSIRLNAEATRANTWQMQNEPLTTSNVTPSQRVFPEQKYYLNKE